MKICAELLVLTLFYTFQFWSRVSDQINWSESQWKPSCRPVCPECSGNPRVALFAQSAELAALSAVSHTAHSALLYITVNCYSI